MRRSLVGTLALLLPLVACADNGSSASSDDDPTISNTPNAKPPTASPKLTADEKKAVAGLEQALLKEGSIDTSIATCLATGLVDNLGIAWLQAHGMLRNDLSGKRAYYDNDVLSEQEANTYWDAQLSCIDYKTLVASMVADPPDMKDPYVLQCVNAVTKADVHDAFAAAASNQDFHSTPFAKKLEAAGCSYEGD